MLDVRPIGIQSGFYKKNLNLVPQNGLTPSDMALAVRFEGDSPGKPQPKSRRRFLATLGLGLMGGFSLARWGLPPLENNWNEIGAWAKMQASYAFTGQARAYDYFEGSIQSHQINVSRLYELEPGANRTKSSWHSLVATFKFEPVNPEDDCKPLERSQRRPKHSVKQVVKNLFDTHIHPHVLPNIQKLVDEKGKYSFREVLSGLQDGRVQYIDGGTISLEKAKDDFGVIEINGKPYKVKMTWLTANDLG